MTDFSTLDISHVSGNAPDDVKRRLAYPGASFFTINGDPAQGTGFANSVIQRMVVTEVSIIKNEEERTRDVGRYVFELVVDKDMVNRAEMLHGGCSAYLVDIGSSIALVALALVKGGPVNHVSQSITMIYHSPAAIGDKLRVVNTTLTMGSRALSAKTEIWNETHHRLVASGVHIKMQPSAARL